MKLNYKRTLFVGFAFFLICAFWQAYDNIIPKILTDKFGMSQMWSGVIMALDNVLAVFLLPLFGALSDKKKTKLGKRTPFILIGTLCAAVLFVGLSFVDNMQLAHLNEIAAVTDTTSSAERDEALRNLYREELDMGKIGKINSTEDQSLANVYGDEDSFVDHINEYGDNTSEWVTKARQAYAWKKTCENPVTLVVFIVIIMGVLVSMSTFRSPAVALMPDVTPKPLRSKANAVINLMGSAGGIIILVLGIVFGTGKTQNTLMSYTVFFMTVAMIMLVSLLIFMLTVKEVKWAAEAEKINDALDGVTEEEAEKHTLSKEEKRSLLFILASVVLWFMGYNAMTSKYSVYAG
ncbi:MAG: MFS transporter, partial [Clostridia bacterium]|nr:MFS transporter [Clostridia bacterium]